jgi:predicted phage-related endonuclease
MTAHRIETRPITNKTEWLLWRLDDVAATDVPVLFNLNPWRTALNLWAEKSHLISPGVDGPAVRRGHWGQPAVLEMMKDERPDWQIRAAKVYLRDPEIRLGATPDAAAIDPEREGVGAIECKTVFITAFERDWPDGVPPIYYQLQTLTQMMLMNASWGAIGALILDRYGNWWPHVFTMQRHPQAEAKICDKVKKFWDDFDAGKVPPLDPARDADTIAQMYPKPVTKIPLDLSADNQLPIVLAERALLQAQMRPLKKRVDEIDVEVKSKVGEYGLARVPGWNISWEMEHRNEQAAKDIRVLRVTKAREHAQ